MQVQWFSDFLAHQPQGVEGAQGVLHDKADLCAAYFAPGAFIELAQVLPGKRQCAGLNLGTGAGEPGEGARGHAFARAGLAHQRQALAGMHLEAHALEGRGRVRAKAHIEVLHIDQRLCTHARFPSLRRNSSRPIALIETTVNVIARAGHATSHQALAK